MNDILQPFHSISDLSGDKHGLPRFPVSGAAETQIMSSLARN